MTINEDPVRVTVSDNLQIQYFPSDNAKNCKESYSANLTAIQIYDLGTKHVVECSAVVHPSGWILSPN
jgi:hypothetical protein